MATQRLIEYDAASAEVRAVYDDILATRKTDYINNFWKALANDPATLKRTWESIKQIMAPGALDALTKELVYIAVSATNQCPYCIASHTASAESKGMTGEMFTNSWPSWAWPTKRTGLLPATRWRSTSDSRHRNTDDLQVAHASACGVLSLQLDR